MKKKKRSRNWKWATAHLSDDTRDCIVTLGWGGVAWVQPGGHDTAERCVLGRATRSATRSAGLRYSLRQSRPARKGEWRAREGLAVGRLSRNTNGHIVTDARLGRWVVSQYGRDTARGSATTRHRKLR